MNSQYAQPVTTRVGAFLCALATTIVVLGSTVAGFQPHDGNASLERIALERVTVSAQRLN